MDITALNVRITVQKNTLKTDSIGNHILDWEDYFSCYATVSGGTGGEKEGAGTVNETGTVNFTVRWCSELAEVEPTRYRILLRNKIYDIEYVDPMGFKKNSLKFKAVLTKR